MSIKYMNHTGYIHNVNVKREITSKVMTLLVAMGYMLIEVK